MSNYYTYENGRKCLHCGRPIADQEHLTTKYCPPIVLPNGKKKSCKDRYHSPRRKIKNMPYKQIADFHKEQHRRIKSLLKAKGETVSVEQINQYGINFYRPVEFMVEKQMVTYYYVGYAFKQFEINKFKIITHGKLF
jgi:hypothetical protein